MASLLSRILGVVGRTARDVVTDVVADELRARTGTRRSATRTRSTAPATRTTPATRTAPQTPGTRPAPASPATIAAGGGRHRGVEVYDVSARGLPSFSYSPTPDGEPDPGEVVWTWVPYEEDATQGKDRPVLVLARQGGGLVVAQLTSKNHDLDREQEARHGRYWFDVGSGTWDSQGRPSEMRLDRLLLVEPAAVRREGACLSRAVFDRATDALRRHWR